MPVFGLLFDLGFILLAATLLNMIAKVLNQPPLLAYILAGILIGPIGLGSLGLSFAGINIGVTTSEQILLLSELGVAFLLFSIGIETNISKLKELGKVAFFGTILQVLITAGFVLLLSSFLNLLSFEQALYLGIIISFSSTTIAVKLLSDSRQITTLHGRLMIGFLLVQDLIAIIALPLLENIANILSLEIVAALFIKVAAILGMAFFLNRFIYPKLFEFAAKSEELFFLSAMSSVFVFIFLSQMLNFSIAVGAFIAGITISNLPYNVEILHRIRGVRDFLATIFFVTLGIQITPSFAEISLQLVILMLFVLIILKPLVFFLITFFSGYGGKAGIAVGLGLMQISEFSFIIANQGKPVLEATPGLYQFIILLISISMAITPYVMDFSGKAHSIINQFFGKAVQLIRALKFPYRKFNKLEKIDSDLSGHVIVFGGGTIGSSIISYLINSGNKVVVIDQDPEVVLSMISQGIDSVYGFAENSDIWEKTAIQKAKIIVIAAPYSHSFVSIVKKMKKINPKAPIFARAHYFKEASQLYNAGADFVIMPQVAGANLFIKKIAEYLETGDIWKIGNYQSIFAEYLRNKAEEEKNKIISNEKPRYL
jgi:CPA2 family monovalent cation:H+ antiporter-2